MAKLHVITGLPGNGKTLFTLGEVEALRTLPASVEMGREVYYHGIPELTLPWKPLADPAKWYDLPKGSIVVIDEAQSVFPPRKQGAAVPESVAQLSTHRHLGIDLFLITQHPQLIDIAVRKLCNRHWHLKRNFGREVSTLSQWEECMNPQDRASANRALKSSFTFPKDRYAWYKSADVHVVQKDFPKKPVAILVGSVMAIGLLAWFAGHRLMSQADQNNTLAAGHASMESNERPVVTWTPEEFEPRAAHWIWSAPFYDKVAEVQSAPRITGCARVSIDSVQTCTCSNDQGGRVDVTQAVCEDFMAGKIYDPRREYVDIKAENIRRLEAAANGNGVGAESEGQVQESRSTIGASSTP